MTITQKPALLSLSGNLADIMLEDIAGDQVTMLFFKSGSLIVEESYQPFQGKLKIKIKDLVHPSLEVEIPDYDKKVFVQNNACSDYTIELTDGSITEIVSFKAIKSFLQKDPFDVELFLRQNWLTFQSRNKPVSFHDPEWLTCFPTENTTIKIAGIFSTGAQQTITYSSLVANKLQSVRLQIGDISNLFNQQLVGFDVWAEVSGQIRQYKQTYILKEAPYLFNDLFVFENRLGGFDTIRFDGQKKYEHSTDFESASMDDQTIEFFADPTLNIEKETGFLKSKQEQLLALDFFRSKNKYHILGGSPARIYTKNLQLGSIPGELINYSFNFGYSHPENAWPEFGISHQNTLIF